MEPRLIVMPRRFAGSLRVSALSLLVLAGGVGSASDASGVSFTDQTVASGVACSHVKDPASDPQVMASGGAAIDFDRDGWQDLFVLSGHGQPDRLFRNNRDGTFTDVAAAAGVNRIHNGLGVAVGDVNKDGWPDLFVTCETALSGPNTSALYLNNGDGTFANVAAAWGVATWAGESFGTGWGAAFGDYDLDGRLDLAVADWLNPTVGNRLYRNTGAAFTETTGPAIGAALAASQGFSPRFCDMNGDRYPELLWTSDFGRSRYLVNNGDGTFTDATASSVTGLDGNGMGTCIGDFNADGRPDWFVTSIFSPNATQTQPGTGNMLYMNQGAHVFSESSAAAGVKQGGWGWGAISADLDLDGDEDLAHTNGWPEPEFQSDQTCVFLNDGTGVFSQVAPACGVTHVGQGRGMINFDYDNDGDQDLVIFTNDGPLALYRNDLAISSLHYVKLRLNTLGSPGLAADGYGAHVVVVAGGRTFHRWLAGGSNFLSQSELLLHLGLGSAGTIDSLTVHWANGAVSSWSNVATNRLHVLRSNPADVDDNGVTQVADIFVFLSSWFSGNGDHDLSGVSQVADIFAFLNDWFENF